VVSYYTDPNGNMLSFPFNSSTPIMYYNKDVFEAAGLDPESPPETWAEAEEAARAIVESGAAPCGFTTSWPSWVMLENFSAWHNMPLGTQANGFEGFDTEFVFNNEHVARHWDNLKAWQDENLFRWGGPGSGPDAFPAFYAGECGFVFGSSASRAGVLANFRLRGRLRLAALLRRHRGRAAEHDHRRRHALGAAGPQRRGIRRRRALLRIPLAARGAGQWHQDTGYLPITQAAYST
jgi:sn-glycerol 3-phosphate transport system substrate-binding protein